MICEVLLRWNFGEEFRGRLTYLGLALSMASPNLAGQEQGRILKGDFGGLPLN